MLGPFTKITGESDHLALTYLAAMGYEFQYSGPIGGFGYGRGAYSKESGKPRLHHGVFRVIMTNKDSLGEYSAEEWADWHALMDEHKVPLESMPPMYELDKIEQAVREGHKTYTYKDVSGRLTELNFTNKTVHVKTWAESERWKAKVLADGLGEVYVKRLNEWGIPSYAMPRMMSPKDIRYFFRAEHRTIDKDIKQDMTDALAKRLADLEKKICP